MGCCLSTTTVTARPTKSKNPDVVTSPNRHHHLSESDLKCRSPPPAPEESVKEVLSETPISKQPTAKKPIKTTTTNSSLNLTKQPDIVQQEVVKKIEPMDLMMSKPKQEEVITVVSEISEPSELCSFSGSFSTTTFNDRDKVGEVTQPVVPRSPAKTPQKRSCSGEIPASRDRGLRSPAKRSAPSPVKRSQVRSRPAAQGRTTTTAAAQRRNVGPGNGTRRDPGEGSLRRSRSPAPRGEAGQRHNVGSKAPRSNMTGQAGGRFPVRKVEDAGKKLEKQDDGVSAEISESLENPHVSLECFIFL